MDIVPAYAVLEKMNMIFERTMIFSLYTPFFYLPQDHSPFRRILYNPDIFLKYPIFYLLQDADTAPPNHPLRYPIYQLIETIRPLIEVHWGI